MRSIAQVLIVGTVCLCSTQALAQGTPGQTRTPDASAQQLRRDLETMKEQMRQMQEKIQQQEEAIEKLSTPEAPPVPTPCTCPCATYHSRPRTTQAGGQGGSLARHSAATLGGA